VDADATWRRLSAIPTLQDFQDEAEKLFLMVKLAENGGNVTRTAEAIETPRSNLYKKIDRYDLRRDRGEGSAEKPEEGS
jgi:two-component system nitrogen regulation response regulator NtrX